MLNNILASCRVINSFGLQRKKCHLIPTNGKIIKRFKNSTCVCLHCAYLEKVH